MLCFRFVGMDCFRPTETEQRRYLTDTIQLAVVVTKDTRTRWMSHGITSFYDRRSPQCTQRWIPVEYFHTHDYISEKAWRSVHSPQFSRRMELGMDAPTDWAKHNF